MKHKIRIDELKIAIEDHEEEFYWKVMLSKLGRYLKHWLVKSESAVSRISLNETALFMIENKEILVENDLYKVSMMI